MNRDGYYGNVIQQRQRQRTGRRAHWGEALGYLTVITITIITIITITTIIITDTTIILVITDVGGCNTNTITIIVC